MNDEQLIANLEGLAAALAGLNDGFRLVGNEYVGRFRVTLLLAAARLRKQDAKAMGAIGGKTRAANLSPERRREIARLAAKARWHG